MAKYLRGLNKVLFVGGVLAGLGSGLKPAIAQLLYPPVSEQRGVSVTGQGRASVPADIAQIDILLTNWDPNTSPDYGYPYPEDMPAMTAPQPEPEPITMASLQGVKEAILGAGIPESAIQINLPTVGTVSYGYTSAEASITLDLEQPTRERVNEIIALVNTTLEAQTPEQTVFVDYVYVQYAINSCEVVEQRAYTAAMEDAELRAQAIADAINVTLVSPPSVAELPFLGRFLSPCNEETDVIGALFWSADSSYYNPEAPAEVEVYRELMVTYPVE
jgi:hypothetical protein